MKTIILVITLLVVLLPSQTNSKEKRFYLTYGERVFELRAFKRALISTIPNKYSSNLEYMIDDVLIYSAKYNVDPVLVISTLWVESAFNTNNVSSAGARGALQIMPKTGDYIFSKILKKKGKLNRDDVSQNIEAGVAYMAYLIKLTNGDQKRAIISYNEGPNSKYFLSRHYVKFEHKYYTLIKEKFEIIIRNLDKNGGYANKKELSNLSASNEFHVESINVNAITKI